MFGVVEDFTVSQWHHAALLDSVDEMLMGGRTYEEFRAFSSTAGQQPMARRVKAMAATVASTTLAEAP